MRPARRSARLVFAVALALAGHATASESLVAITDQPERFENTDVTLVGTVAPPGLAFLRESAWTLRSEGRALTVFSASPAPAPGERVEVSGTLRLRPPDAEFTWPPVLFETARRRLP